MITVYESIARNWLTPLLATIEEGHIVIEVENIPDFAQFINAGLFSSPNDQHFDTMVGRQRHIEFKSFYIRRPFRDFPQRLSNEAYMEAVRDLIFQTDLNSDLPKDGREWISIRINGGIYPAQRQENMQWADYLIPLRLEYIL